MPKFEVNIEFNLSTTVEADGIVFESPDGAEDFSDNSYFQSADVEASGGEIRFTIEAEDEDDAERVARDVVDEGNEVTDYNGLTWLVESAYITVEEVEEPMTLERAIEILQSLADSHDEDEVRAAVAFVLKLISDQKIAASLLEAKVTEQESKIASLA